MTVYGKVLDELTREPVPGATVYLYKGTTKIASVVATNAGEFTITTSLDATAGDKLIISSVGYQEKTFYLTDRQIVYLLTRDEKELPPVVVTAGKKGRLGWWLIAGGLLLTMKKR